MGVVDREREKYAPRVIDAGNRGMRQKIEALLAAVICMRPPVDVADEAGGMAQPALVGRFLGPGRLEENVCPLAQLEGVLDRARAPARIVEAEAQQRVLAPLVRGKQREQEPLADAEHGEHDLARANSLQ